VAAHGDFHVGQILRDPAGLLYVIDFDGNPTLDPCERVAPRPAAYGVAGMMLSLENVGHVLGRRHPFVPDSATSAWTEQVQSEFLAAYRRVAGDLLDDALLPGFVDDQIGRELAYARRYLPDWQYVPEAALRRRGRR
jgi:maltokinase